MLLGNPPPVVAQLWYWFTCCFNSRRYTLVSTIYYPFKVPFEGEVPTHSSKQEVDTMGSA